MMAGQPRRRAMIAELQRRARDYAELADDAPTPSLVEYAVAWIEDGGTLVGLAADMSDYTLVTITRTMVSNYLNAIEGETGAARLAHARARGAHGHAERGLEDLINAPNEDASRLAERVNRGRQWLAERWNRDELGRAPDATVTLNIGTLHLEALQRLPAREAVPLPQLAIEVADALEVTVEEST